VKYGELLLVDLEDNEKACQKPWGEWDYGHAYYISQVTPSTYTLCSGRSIHLKPVIRVIDIRGPISKFRWRNGYFLLPIL
jgi:hypothetical protein